MNLWLIIANIHTTLAVVKLKSENNSGLNGIRSHDVCDTFFSGFNFTTAQVVCITAMINHKFKIPVTRKLEHKCTHKKKKEEEKRYFYAMEESLKYLYMDTNISSRRAVSNFHV